MNKQVTSDLKLLELGEVKVPLFYPFIPAGAEEEVLDTLRSRWIGQGPKVDLFEMKFQELFLEDCHPLAVGSGTDALHLAYLLAGVGPGDEVICPVFTCTATNIPLLYIGAKPVFVDIQKGSLNIDVEKIENLITDKTKAISVVHYGGLPCDMEELIKLSDQYSIPIIEDAAQALGASFGDRRIGSISDFTVFSFQAIKHITSGDGGLLAIKNPELLEKAKRLRWFGIDRAAKQGGVWENDIFEIGYKYQMTDLGAAVALVGLRQFDQLFAHRKSLANAYSNHLKEFLDIEIVGKSFEEQNKCINANWLMTIFAKKSNDLMRKLRSSGVECNRVHFRNDKYTIFRKFLKSGSSFPEMDRVQSDYVVLPMHHKVSVADVEYISEVIKSGW